MEKQFVTYNIALLFKIIGFNEPCFGYYPPLKKELTIWYNPEITNEGEFILVPLWQQAEDWLESKGIVITINPLVHSRKYMIYYYNLSLNTSNIFKMFEQLNIQPNAIYDTKYKTREVAILSGIKIFMLNEIESKEDQLSDLKIEHKETYETYGSELCVGDMIKQEELLENEIKELKEKYENAKQYFNSN